MLKLKRPSNSHKNCRRSILNALTSQSHVTSSLISSLTSPFDSPWALSH